MAILSIRPTMAGVSCSRWETKVACTVGRGTVSGTASGTIDRRRGATTGGKGTTSGTVDRRRGATTGGGVERRGIAPTTSDNHERLTGPVFLRRQGWEGMEQSCLNSCCDRSTRWILCHKLKRQTCSKEVTRVFFPMTILTSPTTHSRSRDQHT